jgi:alpha-L-fucosidase
LSVPLASGVTSARVLGSDGALEFRRSGARAGGLELIVPKAPRDPACTVVELTLSEPPVARPFLVFPDANGVITLLPHDATLDGPSLRVEQVGVVGDVKYNLGYWLDPSASASWPIGVETTEAGVYRVEAELGCADASAGAKMEFLFPSGTLAFDVKATGGWQEYRTVELGRVTLDAGSIACTLRAKSKPGEAVVNVRSIRLVPLAK